MKKIKFISIVFAATFLIFSETMPRIIGASRWMNGNKNVFVYYDMHCLDFEEQFKYLEDKVLKAEKREKPLTVLVENYCCGEHSDMIKKIIEIELEMENKEASVENKEITSLAEFMNQPMQNTFFLYEFNDYINRNLENGIKIKSTDPRGLLKMFAMILREAFNRMYLTKLPDNNKLYDELFELIKHISINSLYKEFNTFFVQAISATKDSNVKKSLGVFYDNFIKKFNDFVKPIKDLGEDNLDLPLLETIKNQSDSKNKNVKGAQLSKLYIYLLKNLDLLEDLWDDVLELKTFLEIMQAEGDIAVFVGAFHANNISKELAKQGFVEKEKFDGDAFSQNLQELAEQSFTEKVKKEFLDLIKFDQSKFDWMHSQRPSK